MKTVFKNCILLDDFRALSNPYMVVARGKVYEQPKIEKYTTCDAELDKYYG